MQISQTANGGIVSAAASVYFAIQTHKPVFELISQCNVTVHAHSM
jgi:hypothetical protein